MWTCFLFVASLMVIFMVVFLSSMGGPRSSTKRSDKIIDPESNANPSLRPPAYPPPSPKSFDVLYMIGGKDGRNGSSVDVLTKRGVCNLPDGYPSFLPATVFGHVAGVNRVTEHVVVCGGLSTDSMLNQHCWSYDPTPNQWRHLTRLRWPTAYASAVVTDANDLVIMGGNNNGHYVSSSQVLNLNSESWRLGPEMEDGSWGHCSLYLPDGQIVVIGGWTDRSGPKIHGMRAAKTYKRSWTKLPNLQHGRATHSCMVTSFKVSETRFESMRFSH